MSVFRQVIPNSFINASNESFEHFLIWLSPNGGVRSWLFSSTEGETEEQFDNFSIETIDDIRSVPSMDRIEIQARTKSLESEQFDYVKSIFKSNRVYKVNKDFSKIPIAIKGRAVSQPNQLKEFEVRVAFSYQEEDILNL